MKQADDIARLVALRRLREERARTAMAVEAARLEEKRRVLAEAEAAIEAHDAETDERERKFLEAMNIRPLSESELGRAQDRILLSGQRREALIEERNQVAKAVDESEVTLIERHAEWRRRLFARDKLADVQERLLALSRASDEARSELEIEEMSADRVGTPC